MKSLIRSPQKFALVKKVAMVGVPLIFLQLGYIYLFGGNSTPTVQVAINNAVEKIKGADDRRKAMLKIQLALNDYMTKNGGTPPASLNELRPVYFDSIPSDPKTGKPFSYKIENGRFYLAYDLVSELGTTPGKQAKNKTPPVIETPEVQQVAFVYDPTGKRDPFRPFDFAPKIDLDGKSPLERYEYGQLRLVAVIGAGSDSKALVENSVGKGFTVSKGTKIGMNGGEIVEIKQDRILIIESQVDFTGEKKTKTIEMRLRTKDQERSSSTLR